MRSIDADALKKTLEDMCSASNDIKQRRIEDIMLHNIFPQIIDDEPTIETITREQYHDMTKRFFDEFVDNGANEETVAKCMFIGLAFGKLELMLFGENEDGDSE